MKIVVGPSGRDSIAIVPPIIATRSLMPSRPRWGCSDGSLTASGSKPRPSSSMISLRSGSRLEDDAHGRRRRVLEDVRQRLLDDPVDRRLDRGGALPSSNPELWKSTWMFVCRDQSSR